jgi:hypothetical protein
MAANTEVQRAVAGWPCLTPKGLRLRFTPVAPSPKQAAFLALTNREALFGGSAGSGKMLDLSTVVLSTKGWTTMGELQVGDMVFDHEGEPTRVLWKSPACTPTTYRVTMSDGEVVTACADHLWNVADERQRANYQHTDPRWQAQRRARRPSRGLTDEQRAVATDGRARGTALAAVQTNVRRAQQAREVSGRPSVWDYTTTLTTAAVAALAAAERKRVAIPNGAPLHAPGSWRSAIPPYTLGVWLGDGGASDGYIYCCDDDLPALTVELEADGWEVHVASTSTSGRSQPFHSLRLVRDGVPLRSILRAEGLFGNKHVPDWVHLAPYADRQAFLGGFCDTDGTVNRRGRVEFCLAREDMVRDVHSMFWGIGEKPSRVTRRATRNQVEGFTGEAWRFSIARCSQYLFRLPRKRDRLAIDRGCGSRNEYRSIESIEEVDPVPMQCITVDNPRGLYRVGRSHLTTHNSAALLMAALMFCDVPGYNALILRRTLTDLKLPDGLIDVSNDWLAGTGAKYNANDFRWTFPKPDGNLEGGGVLQFGYMSSFGSETRYKSSQYQLVAYDELTEFPWEDQYLYLQSRMRSSIGFHPPAADGLTVDQIPLRMRAATNPGGVGGDWVRKRFVSPDTAIRPFLPGRVYDNPGLNAEEYLASLAELPEVERRRLEDGDWDVFEIPGALWKVSDLAWTDRTEPRPVSDVDVRAMSIDPAVTDETGKGDETGILIGSVTGGDLTVELDLSGRMHPDDWARKAVSAYHQYGCSSVIVEDNQGKALLHGALGNAADQLGLDRPTLAIITAKESKEARAIPVAQAYRSTPRRVYHDLTLKGGRLENQLTSWVPRRPTAKIPSPDRLDALVWLVRHLLWNEGKSAQYRTPRSRQSVASMMAGQMPGA